MTGARLRTGIVFVVLYVALAVAYNTRPLFDGFAPPPPYNWVNPPKEFRSGNVVPKPSSVDVALGPTGSAQGGGSSDDGQVIVSIAAGAFAPHSPDTKVTVHITPVDPATLAPPPAGLLADGNAYRIDLSYEPSKTPVPMATPATDIFLVVPEPAQTLLYSADGKSWDSLPFRPVPDPTQIGGAVAKSGYLLAVAPPVGRLSEVGTGGRQAGRVFQVASVIAALAAALWLLPVGLRQLRRRPS